MNKRSSRSGMTLLEVAIVSVIIGVLVGVTFSGMRRWQENERSRAAVREVADLFRLAAAEAIRTGQVHIVFLSIAGAGDAAGNPLEDPGGDWVPVLMLNDGELGSAGQNCDIDAGEAREVVVPVDGIGWGSTFAGTDRAPGDDTGISIASGSSFATPAGAGTTWVAFMPDGRPLGFDNACNMGQLGSGNGAVYLTNGSNDYAVVVNPLGGVRIHMWNREAGQWQI